MVPDEEDKVERFMGGLPDNIQGNRAPVGNYQDIICYECGRPRHFRKDCLKLRNQNRGNHTKNRVGNKTGNHTGDTFLLNNCYAFMLFDLGADRSFMSSTFSALLDVAPSTLDTSYAIELADGRVLKTNVVLRGCTLRLLEYHALIFCDEKVVRIPYRDEVLIIRGDNFNDE
nr:hypothetical protein [Tanacetum cinerariifolium]